MAISPRVEELVGKIKEADDFVNEARSKAHFHEASLVSARSEVTQAEHKLSQLQNELMKAIKNPGATPAPGLYKANKLITTKVGTNHA